MKTLLRSEEADCGGVGVLGDVGTEADAGVVVVVVSGSVSAMLRKVILCGGSLSRGTGWPFRVPEVDVRTGRIPGDFSVYKVLLGCGARNTHPTTVGLVLVLLDLSCDFSHFPPLAEVDQLLAVALEEVGVAFLRLQDVG
ncbi:hypothetical protein EYF80_024121 [Liparis tanakae]|uniref:Uncharacterized protein n=1 Tax=Liparis tanakae TaxID=230148 RepID=A0A4Z2HLD4_9TELE|nr:hypothetical protein EYF80_024121 [Liparis tanakae]